MEVCKIQHRIQKRRKVIVFMFKTIVSLLTDTSIQIKPHLAWFYILLFKGEAECEGQAVGLISFVNFVFFRMNFVSTSSSIHLARMEFLENKHHMQAFLILAESQLKSWIIKYGRQESVELMLHNYVVSSGFDSLCTWFAETIIKFLLYCLIFRYCWKSLKYFLQLLVSLMYIHHVVAKLLHHIR